MEHRRSVPRKSLLRMIGYVQLVEHMSLTGEYGYHLTHQPARSRSANTSRLNQRASHQVARPRRTSTNCCGSIKIAVISRSETSSMGNRFFPQMIAMLFGAHIPYFTPSLVHVGRPIRFWIATTKTSIYEPTHWFPKFSLMGTPVSLQRLVYALLKRRGRDAFVSKPRKSFASKRKVAFTSHPEHSIHQSCY
jgi:hypothetical protein